MRIILILILAIFITNAKTQFEKDKEMAQYFDAMALTYRQVGDLQKAKEYTLKELSITEKIYPTHVRLGTSYTNYSTLLKEMGELSLAKEYAIKGLNIYENQKIDNNIMGLLISYNNLALIYGELKQYDKATKYLDKALNGFKKNNQTFYIATAYYNLALVQEKLNQLKASKEYVIQAISLFEQIEKKLENFKYKKINKTSSNQDINDLLKYKLELQKEGISTLLSTKTSLGNARNLLAKLINGKKEVDNTSINMVKQTIDENIIFLGEEHPQMAEYYNELAMLYMQEGNLTEAKYQIEKSIYIGQEKFNKNSLVYMRYLANYSLILYDMFNKGLSNDIETAFLVQRQSFEIFKRNTYKNFMSLSEEEQITYLGSDKNERMQSWIKMSYLFMVNQYEMQFSLHKSQKDKRLEAKMKKLEVVKIMADDWLNYKGRIFDNSNILSLITSSTLLDRFKTLTKNLSNLYQQSFVTGKLKKLNEQKIKECIQNRKNIEIKLRKESEIFQKLTLNSINYRDISKKLTRNQIYIDYLKFEDMYFMLIIREGEGFGIVHISESKTKDINKYVKEFKKNNKDMIKLITNDKPINIEKDKKRLKKDSKIILSKLYNILIQKYLSTQLKTVNELIISPDGLLNFLPFEALYHNGKYLIEDYKVSYISSGREFVRQTRREKANFDREMICFGNPDFNASLSKSAIKNFGGNDVVEGESWKQFQSFEPIGNKEIVTINKFYKDALVYEKENATVENLMGIGSSKVLHLSTHGKFLNNENIHNPMLKAGLAFSGANKNIGEIATALKLSALDLKDTELVVLSACESGVGEVQNAEGVMGLPKAFLQAGARNVIMSLWSVSNQKTAELMDSFYSNVKEKNQDYETALRNAKLDMIEEHPYYWSAFIMHGI